MTPHIDNYGLKYMCKGKWEWGKTNQMPCSKASVISKAFLFRYSKFVPVPSRRGLGGSRQKGFVGVGYPAAADLFWRGGCWNFISSILNFLIII